MDYGSLFALRLSACAACFLAWFGQEVWLVVVMMLKLILIYL
jgi:hypothetical protein